jgi:hypothetical protein
VDEINRSGVESIYLNKPVVSRILVVRMFIFALFLASAYFILIAYQQQQTLSIVIRPCGNDSSGV